MGRDRQRRGTRDTSRDHGGFIALPWSVVDSAAFQRLSPAARSLLLEVARQVHKGGAGNGRCLLTAAYLGPRGWRSADTIYRARAELLNAGFLFQTAQGCRPSKASLYAVTWFSLDQSCAHLFDPGTVGGYQRSAYAYIGPPTPLIGAEATGRTAPSGGVGRRSKKRIPTSVGGVEKPAAAPSGGVGEAPAAPADGAVKADFGTSPTPSIGDPLETPSAGAASTARPAAPHAVAPHVRSLLDQAVQRAARIAGGRDDNDGEPPRLH